MAALMLTAGLTLGGGPALARSAHHHHRRHPRVAPHGDLAAGPAAEDAPRGRKKKAKAKAGASASRSKVAATRANLLRTGFRVTPRGSEVSIETSAEVELETRPIASGRTFVLKGCKVVRANDRRALDTSYFGSPVTGVRLRQRGRNLEVRVALRAPSDAISRKERGPDDTWRWILEFPVVQTADGAASPAPALAVPRAAPRAGQAVTTTALATP
jgi:hypothetical protein